MTRPETSTGAPIQRHYGRRRGRRLRPTRQALLATLLPRLRLPPLPPDGDAYGLADVLGPGRDGGGRTDLWLEIGFGAGEHLAAMAAAHPDVGFIGCEPYVNGVASLLAQIERLGLDNIRLFDDDARLLLPALPEARLGRVMLLFPDPWPKKRHAHRRFVCDEIMDRLACAMRDRAEFRFASDDEDYVDWTVDIIARHPAFMPADAEEIVCTSRPPGWPPTRYEEKALARGARCTYLTVLRRPREQPA